MLKRPLGLKNYFTVVVTKDKLFATLSDSEWVTVKDIGDLLELFMHAQKTLKGQKFVTNGMQSAIP